MEIKNKVITEFTLDEGDFVDAISKYCRDSEDIISANAEVEFITDKNKNITGAKVVLTQADT